MRREMAAILEVSCASGKRAHPFASSAIARDTRLSSHDYHFEHNVTIRPSILLLGDCSFLVAVQDASLVQVLTPSVPIVLRVLGI